MKIFILSAYPEPHDFTARWLIARGKEDSFGVHQLADNPEEADLILFAEGHTAGQPYFLGLHFHPIYRRYRKKCFLYHDEDVAVPIFPGLYPSLELRDYDPSSCIGASYMARLAENPVAVGQAPLPPDALLFSFVGASLTHPVRNRILALNCESAVLRDTSGRQMWTLSGSEKLEYAESYRQSILNAQFILCPRGHSPTSYRLFESMEMGRAPVIISDDFTEFDGPEWSRFSVRIPERDVERIPEILERIRHEAVAMGLEARRQWEKWIAPAVSFHRTCEACLAIAASRKVTPPKSRIPVWLKFLQPRHLRNVLRFGWRNWIRRPMLPKPNAAKR